MRYLSRLLAAERRLRGTRRATRALTCWYQALLVLAWFRTGGDKTLLGAGFGISRATSYRYLAEGTRSLHPSTRPANRTQTSRRPRLVPALRKVSLDAWRTGKIVAAALVF